ncbi:MAG: helix-turn-helix domain-containing protein [Oscillospiraceae bacterium]|jgi:transcriptional regulator with XRE-family HTH domain|nr:helix-turn-helix domain-containing protein [Oscillospiraceae bacterium]
MATTIGQTIKRLRSSLMLTQQDLANILNLSPKTVSKWETNVGIPALPYIVSLARALGVTTDELLNESDTVKTEPAAKSSVHPFTHILEARGIRLELNLTYAGGLDMENKIDYRRIAEEVQKTLPGEVISVHLNTVTRSNGSDKYTITGESWKIECPSIDDIAAMVDGLFTPGNYFAILSPNSSVIPPGEYPGNCAYVQAAVVDENGQFGKTGEYCVETQFWIGWDKDKGVTNPDFKQKQYRLNTRDAGVVVEIFKSFASGIVPDISDWVDVTR